MQESASIAIQGFVAIPASSGDAISAGSETKRGEGESERAREREEGRERGGLADRATLWSALASTRH